VTKPSYLAEQLAAFAVDQKRFPPEVLNEGKRLILDQLACQIAFATLPWSLAYRDAVLSLGLGTGATVVYHGDKVPLDQAAFLNSAFGHGGEFDDSQLGSNTHSGAVVLPPVLALAERKGISGAHVLQAVVVGIEVMVRIGAAASPHLGKRGFHAPPTVGPFGAAAGSARAMGLSRSQCAQAIAIAGSHAGGTREYTRSGGTIKRAHCAIPAMSGLRSAIMAECGITGPLSAIEGDRGLLDVYAGQHNPAAITKDLGKDYLLVETAYKPITSPWPSHAPLEALGWLQKEYQLTPPQVLSVEIGTSEEAMKNVKTIREPKDILDAQYSLAFGVAVRLYRGGNGFHDYREEDVHDRRFLELAERVSFRVDPVCDAERIRLRNRSAVVTVVTHDGRKLEKRVQYSKGHPKNPLTDDDLTAKFVASVEPVVGTSRAAQMVDRIWAIEKMENAGELIELTLKSTSSRKGRGK
jgi:2-methylcitrate dehydratase PrpD